MAYIPPTNTSVSGTVGASVIGVVPIGGSVLAMASILGTAPVTQATSPWVVTGSVQGSFSAPVNQSVSGTINVGNSYPWVITGSVQAAITPAANQSVSGTVNIGNAYPWVITGSVQGSFSPAANQSVSGTVGSSTIGTIPTTQAGTWISSIVSTVPSSVLVGASAYGAFPVTQSGAWTQSVVGTIGASVIGTIPTTQAGIWISSIVSTVPSSVLVGASIFGLAPVNVTNTNLNVSGSVAAFLTGNASVIAVQKSSIATVITSVATANGGLPVWSPLTSRIQGTADLRVVQGASVAAIAAQGAGVRSYIDHIQVVNFGSASVLVTIADNTTSILGYTIAPAGGGSNYDCFYRPAANSPITASINGTASVLVSMQGFTSST